MNSLVVASIDFGTTYSGCAFSFKHEFERNPIEILAKQWYGETVSLKAPTCVLIKPDGKTAHSCGYEAEKKYASLAEDDEHKEWYFFKRFKMMLFGRIGLERSIYIEDVTGKKLKAKKVFSASIEWIKNDLVKMMESRIFGGGLTSNDIHWVLTVPAIWNDSAKQFMRLAAQKAGIPEEKLDICLEPEAASIYCRHLPVEKQQYSLSNFKAGTRYLVLDAGGGTVDITVHEITIDGSVKELLAASGGPWGGTKVDDAYEHFLTDISSAAVMEQFKDSHMEDYLDMLRDFEIKKRDIAPNKDEKMTLRLPSTFKNLVKSIHNKTLEIRIANTKYRDEITVKNDKLRLKADIAKGFFDSAVTSILNHLKALMKEPKARECIAILMVGGFSESPMLQENITNTFSGMKIIVPKDAGLAVLKGAVIYGHNPTAIVERVCRYTYGTNICHLKNSETCTHPPARTLLDDNHQERCDDIFHIYVKIGQSVKLGEETQEMISVPINDSQTKIGYRIFASSSLEPYLTTEQGCTEIGELIIPISDTSLGKNRKFGCTFMFGGTEIEVKVVDKATGDVITKCVDFLG